MGVWVLFFRRSNSFGRLLPLYLPALAGYSFFSLAWSLWRELNPRPLPYQGSALPLSYKGRCVFRSPAFACASAALVERETRFEPATFSLEG